MREGQEINNDKQRADHYFHCTERFADFLEWLFDTDLWYTTQREMWEKFEAFEDERDKKNKP